MALVTTFTCSRCHEECTELVLPNRVCSVCRREDNVKADRRRRMDLAALKGLTTEERLARLEELAYSLNGFRAKIEAQDARHTTY